MHRRNFLKGFLATATIVALAPLSPIVELPVKNATFEELVAVTLKSYRKILADNICNAQVKWEMFYARDCINIHKGSVITESISYL